MICSSRFSDTILEKVAENAMPMSMKLSTGLGSRLLHRESHAGGDENGSTEQSQSQRRTAFLFNTTPANRPVTTPITNGKMTIKGII